MLRRLRDTYLKFKCDARSVNGNGINKAGIAPPPASRLRIVSKIINVIHVDNQGFKIRVLGYKVMSQLAPEGRCLTVW